MYVSQAQGTETKSMVNPSWGKFLEVFRETKGIVFKVLFEVNT